jgi:16S rRNA (cytidine1402-2'-O)-methyltransferase
MSHDDSLVQIARAVKGRKPKPGLYVVATPIGNKLDITLRALQTLGGVDWVAAEDTRHSQKLLASYGLEVKMISYHDHNELTMAEKLAEKIQAGQSIALISDAGTPLISDPGYRLLRACVAAEIPITIIPGASSVIAAVAVSGLPPLPFYFAGFLPQKGMAKKIAALAQIQASLVLFESPLRVVETLQALAQGLGDRPAAIARELTKNFEELKRGSLLTLADYYTQHPPKGEVVLMVDNHRQAEAASGDIDNLLHDALTHLSVKDAAEQVARDAQISKRQAYQRALTLKGGV